MATSAASAFEEVKETLGAWLVPSQPANGALEGVQGLDASDAVVCSAARALLCAALEQCSSPYTPAAAEELARIITRVCSVDFKATRPQFALELLDELLSSVSLQNAKSILDRVNLAELLTGAADDGGASPLALQVLLKVLNGLLERASPVLHAPFRTQLMLLQCLHAGIDHRSGLNLLKLYSAESELHETSVGGKARSTPLAKFIGFAHSVTRLAPVPDTTTDSKTENTTPASSSSSSSSVSSSSMSYAGLLEFTAVSNSLLGTFSGRQSTNKGKQTLVSRMDTATAPLLSSADMSDPEIVALHDPLRACVCVQILILALHVSQSFCGSPDCPSDVKAKVDALVVAAKRTLTRLDKPTEKLWHKIAALESTWTGWKDSTRCKRKLGDSGLLSTPLEAQQQGQGGTFEGLAPLSANTTMSSVNKKAKKSEAMDFSAVLLGEPLRVEATRKDPFVMGHRNLHAVWAATKLKGQSSLTQESMAYVPSFEELMGNLEDEAQEIQDGDVSIDDDGLYRRDPMFAFKCFRLLGQNPGVLGGAEPPKDDAPHSGRSAGDVEGLFNAHQLASSK